MSVTTFIRRCIDAGMPTEMALIAAEAFEAEIPPPVVDDLTPRQRRNKRYYEEQRRLKASETVLTASEKAETSEKVETPFLSSPPSPRPLSTTTNLSQEPPIVPQAKGRKRALRRTYPADFEACWTAYPHYEGRSSKPNAADEFDRMPAEERASLLAAIAKFRPKVAEVCGGKGAPDMAVWLKAGKHLAWMAAAGAAATVALPKFPNAAIRSYVVGHKGDPFAVSYLDSCSWSEADGLRTITAPNTFVASRLKADVPALEQRGIRITVQTAEPKARSAA